MASIDSMVLVIEKNQLKQMESSSLALVRRKAPYKANKASTCERGEILEREAKKPRAVQTLLRKHRKQQVR